MKLAWDAAEWRGLLQAVRVGEEALLHVDARQLAGIGHRSGARRPQDEPPSAAHTWSVLILRCFADSIARELHNRIGDVVVRVADTRVEFLGSAIAVAIDALDRRSGDPTWAAARQKLAGFNADFTAAGADA
jgi:hypothetical protein